MIRASGEMQRWQIKSGTEEEQDACRKPHGRAGHDESKTPMGPPAAAAPPGALGFDTAAVDAAMGFKGKANGPVFQVSIPRAEPVKDAGMEVPEHSLRSGRRVHERGRARREAEAHRPRGRHAGRPQRGERRMKGGIEEQSRRVVTRRHRK